MRLLLCKEEKHYTQREIVSLPSPLVHEENGGCGGIIVFVRVVVCGMCRVKVIFQFTTRTGVHVATIFLIE